MRKKPFSPSLLFLVILFALGILFASQYTPGTERIVTFSVDDCDGEKLLDCVDQLTRTFTGVEKIFVDTKANIFSVRYESSLVTLDSVKSFFSEADLVIKSSNSVNLMRKEEKSKDKRLFKISFSSLE